VMTPTPPKRSFRVRFQSVGGRRILIQRDQTYELDEVGGRIWELCDGTRSAADIAGALTQEYDVTPEQALADVQEFVQDLKAKGLLE